MVKKAPASEWAAKFGRPATATEDAVVEPTTLPEVKKPAARRAATKTRGSASVKEASTKAVKAPVVDEEPEGAPEPAPVRARAVKFAATYRLPEDALDLIDLAVANAAAKGRKLSKEAAVAEAIRKAYGRLAK